MQTEIVAHTGEALRHLIRSKVFTGQTAGQAPDHLQGNVVILPKSLASNFLQFCHNNPKPCPLIGLSRPGSPNLPELGNDLDIRTDVPRYKIYRNGNLDREVTDISALWSDTFVTFVLGCSFSFEDALIRSGFPVRHIDMGRNVPMFKTSVETTPTGPFNGPLVVSMRPYPAYQIAAIYDICSKYPNAHGTPVHWGNPSDIGIDDIMKPDYGDAVDITDDEMPVFWACGVTPQAAIEQARPDICITHAPGHMLVSDRRSDETLTTTFNMKELLTESTQHRDKHSKAAHIA